MGLFRKLSEVRERQILEHAEPLQEGEKVLAWVRTTKRGRSARGFMFVTNMRILFSWSRVGTDENTSVPWEQIEAWGIASDGVRGPLFALETDTEVHEAHILVGTDGLVAKANQFLVHFVDNVPPPVRSLARVEDPDRFTSTEFHLQREKKTVGKHTRRAIVTIIGLCLIVFAFLIGWIPGPWSIPLVIAGLAVLATEYDWADDFLTWARQRYEKTKAKLKARRSTAE